LSAGKGGGVKKTIAPVIAWISVCVLSIAQAVYYYPQLPDRVASHFGVSGRPDAWSSREDFLIFYFVMVGIVIVVFTVLPYLASIMPMSWVNLPNKEYWSAPEREAETRSFLRYYPLWFGSATMLLLIDVMRQAFLVNIGTAKSLGHPMFSLALYIGFSVIWIIGLLIRFLKPKA
jgi:uncharacterized membrane protein